VQPPVTGGQLHIVRYLEIHVSGPQFEEIHWNFGSRTLLIMNKSVHKQISEQKSSRVMNGFSSNEHASQQQQLATSWEYRQESVSCCVTFAQYTSPLEFAVPSLECHCCLWFFLYIYILLTLCSRVVNLIKYPLMPGRFKFFECSTPKCTVTYILTL
jgi:hypothetical protein